MVVVAGIVVVGAAVVVVAVVVVAGIVVVVAVVVVEGVVVVGATVVVVDACGCCATVLVVVVVVVVAGCCGCCSRRCGNNYAVNYSNRRNVGSYCVEPLLYRARIRNECVPSAKPVAMWSSVPPEKCPRC